MQINILPSLKLTTESIRLIDQKFKMAVLIDDDEVSNYINSINLKKTASFESIETFKGGHSALDFLRQRTHDSLPFPEMIFVDVNMPAMSGWEFVAEYMKIEKLHRQNTKVAVMSIVFSEEDDILLKQHENEVIKQAKPLTIESLEILVEKYRSPQ